jgi:ADP-heptose:LPS heptosyltransferase
MASGQEKFQIDSLGNVGKRGLWLYAGEGQVGDALMDLAPRSLLQAQGFHMDLLTDPHLARLFQDDPWFANVTDDAAVLAAVPYDFVMLLSHKRRSLQPKSKHFKNLPWVSILENFTGPNFDRSGYATQRLSDLLGLELSPAEFTEHARQKLKPRLAPAGFEQESAHLAKAVALSIGGVDPLRTYSAWPQVMAALMRHGLHEFLLVGSDNGIADAQRIEQAFGTSARIHNYVGKCSLAQSHDLLAAARVAVCTDGGLMHLAATTATPVLGLFSAAIDPEWRLHPRPGIACVRSNSADVNDASVQEIVEKTLLLCNAAPQAQPS